MSATRIIEEAGENIKKAMTRLSEIFEYMHSKKRKKQLTFNTARGRIGLIRGFLTHNGIGIPKRYSIAKPAKSESKKVHEKSRVWDNGALNDTIRTFFDDLSLTHGTIGLCLLYTGQKTKIILGLNVDFLLDAKGKLTEDERLFLSGERIKTRNPFSVFIGGEATAALKRYYEQMRKKAKPTDPLFIDERGSRVSSRAVQDAYRRVATKMGYTSKQNPFAPTRLRHVFMRACQIAKIPDNIMKLFVGHATDISAVYGGSTQDDM
ncbi:MAG: tyrosine-type recombinase/integrase [Candidatus Thorarchaeota archaeon]|nr:MAG: tyrosine-type recombinase/integrase [Candidatus Thorarchaeota archaeon]